MSLNIKDEETHRLVRELARLTGESQTAAVTIAVQERLDRLQAVGRRRLADRLLAIGKGTAPEREGGLPGQVGTNRAAVAGRG